MFLKHFMKKIDQTLLILKPISYTSNAFRKSSPMNINHILFLICIGSSEINLLSNYHRSHYFMTLNQVTLLLDTRWGELVHCCRSWNNIFISRTKLTIPLISCFDVLLTTEIESSPSCIYMIILQQIIYKRLVNENIYKRNIPSSAVCKSPVNSLCSL